MTNHKTVPEFMKLFEHVASDLILAKEHVRQMKETAQKDIDIIRTQLDQRHERMKTIEADLLEIQHTAEALRQKNTQLKATTDRELSLVAGVETMYKKLDTANMNSRLDEIEAQSHKMREIHEASENASALWKKEYEKKAAEMTAELSEAWKAYDLLFDEHETCAKK